MILNKTTFPFLHVFYYGKYFLKYSSGPFINIFKTSIAHSFVIVFFFVLKIGSINAQYSTALNRLNAFGKGVNANQWLTPNKSVFDPSRYSRADFVQMKNIGFNHVRIPVSYDKWFEPVAGKVNDTLNKWVDSAVVWALQSGLRAIIDLHPSGTEDYYLLNQSLPNFTQNKNMIASIWRQVAQRYLSVPKHLLMYEIYNEPGYVDENAYSIFAQQVIDSIRKVDVDKTIIIEGPLSKFHLLSDTNLVGTFHFYNPGNFTHQGATWTPLPRNTVSIPFPYDPYTMPPIHPIDAADPFALYQYVNYDELGTVNKILSSIEFFYNSSKQYANVPIYVGEFGVSNLAPVESRLYWMEIVRKKLDSLQTTWAVWSWKGFNTPASFQMFNCNNCIDSDSVYSTSSGYTQLCALDLTTQCFIVTSQTSYIEESSNNLTFYPNPTTDKILITSKELSLLAEGKDFTVFNHLGVMVKKGKYYSTKGIDVNGFSNGLYSVYIDVNNQIYFGKFLKTSR